MVENLAYPVHIFAQMHNEAGDNRRNIVPIMFTVLHRLVYKNILNFLLFLSLDERLLIFPRVLDRIVLAVNAGRFFGVTSYFVLIWLIVCWLVVCWLAKHL